METKYAGLMSHMIGPAELIIRPWRVKAVARLSLQPGNWVVDAGCGTGSSFAYLLQAVGQSGHVVGIEIDPSLAAKARGRIQKNGWNNVDVIQADAQSVDLRQHFDGLLMFAAHEILTSSKALDRLLPVLKDHARVVSWGAKQAASYPARLVNPLLRLASRRWLPHSVPFDARPWRLLETRLEDFVVEESASGIIYLVSGTARDSKSLS